MLLFYISTAYPQKKNETYMIIKIEGGTKGEGETYPVSFDERECHSVHFSSEALAVGNNIVVDLLDFVEYILLALPQEDYAIRQQPTQ